MAADRIYGDFQTAGFKITTTGKSQISNAGTDAYALAFVQVDTSGTPVGPSGTNPNTNPATSISGQAIIAVTGTAVRAKAVATPLINGAIVSALSTNTALAGGVCGTCGPAGITNAATGSGTGYILQPGAGASLAISDLSNLWFNGTAGDIFSYLAS